MRRSNSVFVVAGFDLLETNWPFEPGFVMFCYNTIAYLGTEFGALQQTQLNVGKPITVEGLTPDIDVRVSGPSIDASLKTSADGVVRFHATDRVGTYAIEIPQRPPKVFAVNLLDTLESNIEPLEEVIFSGQVVQARQNAGGRSNVPVWPFLIVFVLALAFIEWLIYNAKVRI